MLQQLLAPIGRLLRPYLSQVEGVAHIASMHGCACVDNQPCSLVASGQCHAASGDAVVRMHFQPAARLMGVGTAQQHALDVAVPCGVVLHTLDDLRRDGSAMRMRLTRQSLHQQRIKLADVLEIRDAQGLVFRQS